jgi:glycerol-3-phosphate acyltransferase PlsY
VDTVLVLVLSYLLGSIPTGAIAGRLRGVDLRRQGSGNLGATNALRVLGPAVGVPVLAVDVAKGTLAVLAVTRMAGPDAFLGPSGTRLAAGLAAIAGHVWPVFAGFRGGKGVATTCGVFLAMAPLATAVAIVVWALLVAVTRYVSVGSMVAASLLPFAIAAEAAARGEPRPTALLVTAGLVAAAVAVLHRANIRRLVAGTENRFAFKKQEDS